MDLKETELLYKYKTKGPAEAGTLLVFTGKSLMQLVRSRMVLASLINPHHFVVFVATFIRCIKQTKVALCV